MTGNRLWTLGAVFLIVVILVLGYVVGVSPRLAEAAADAQQQQQVDSQNGAESASLAKLKANFEKLDSLRAQLAAAQVAIPSDPDGKDFIDTLAVAAVESGVFFKDATLSEATIYSGTTPVQPGTSTTPAPAPTSTPTPAPTVAPTTSTPAAGATTVATGPVSGQAYVMSVLIDVQGPPSKVFAFVKLVQSSPRFFINSKVSFQSEGASPSGVSSGSSGGSGGGSTDQATLTGYLFLVAGTNAVPAVPTPASTSTPTPTPTGAPTSTPTSTATPTP